MERNLKTNSASATTSEDDTLLAANGIFAAHNPDAFSGNLIHFENGANRACYPNKWLNFDTAASLCGCSNTYKVDVGSSFFCQYAAITNPCQCNIPIGGSWGKNAKGVGSNFVLCGPDSITPNSIFYVAAIDPSAFGTVLCATSGVIAKPTLHPTTIGNENI